MKKISEKIIYINFAIIILILGYLIFHFYRQNNTALQEDAPSAAADSDFTPEWNVFGENTAKDVLSEDELFEQLRYEDYGNFANEDYTSALISMFSTDSFDRDRLYYYTASSCMICQHAVRDLEDLSKIFSYIPTSLESMYLILAPDQIAKSYAYDSADIENAYREMLIPYIRNHTETTFFLTLPYYSLPYLQELSPEEQTRLVNSYYDFAHLFFGFSNVIVYFWGAQEWLVANPANYSSDSSCVPAVSEKLSCFWFDRLFLITEYNIDEEMGKMKTLLRRESPNELLADFDPVTGICDHSLDTLDIIFFGDSVIGNFSGPLSIPGAVEGLSGAHTYNLGIGGTSAAMYQSGEGHFYLNEIVDAFLAKDSRTVSGTAAEADFTRYFEEHQKIVFRKPCFVINYGLNDYFMGLSIEYPDSAQDNLYTYKGALYSAVKKLKDAYPVSTIIINTPNYISSFHCGTDLFSEDGEKLEAYALAVAEIAQTLDVLCIDNYTGLGFTADNMEPYMRDGVHPGELGRYLISKKIIASIIHFSP